MLWSIGLVDEHNDNILFRTNNVPSATNMATAVESISTLSRYFLSGMAWKLTIPMIYIYIKFQWNIFLSWLILKSYPLPFNRISFSEFFNDYRGIFAVILFQELFKFLIHFDLSSNSNKNYSFILSDKANKIINTGIISLYHTLQSSSSINFISY